MINFSEEDVYNYILEILSKNSPLPIQDKKEILKFRYLDAGQIDSLNLIRFIMSIEEKFNIHMSNEDTDSDEFRYVKGLINLILKKIH